MKTTLTFIKHAALWLLLSTLTPQLSTWAQGTAFTYQGRLNDGANLANGSYDLRFIIYDNSVGGSQQGPILTNSATTVSSGLFIATLDFGANFPGPARWLEIAVRTNGGGGFATLSPRQPLTPSPYAIMAGDVSGANIARLNVPNTATTATGVPTITSGFITSATVTSGGSGYTTAPLVTVTDTTGSGASVTATVSNGAVVNLTVQSPGHSYSSNATFTIGAPPSNAYQVFSGTSYFTGLNTFSNPSNTFAGGFTGNGAGLTNLNDLNAWQLSGNLGTSPGLNFLGTRDNQPLELKVDGRRALRLEPTANDANHSNIVNVVGGSPANFVAPGVYGATIAGGGGQSSFGSSTNSISSDFGVIGGGFQNTITTNATAIFATIGGGFKNTANEFAATVGGGNQNTATGGSEATVGGGFNNTASSSQATVGGGGGNTASGGQATVGGGGGNTASGQYATIPGGFNNTAAGVYSFAAGNRAKANHQGTFVWADSQSASFASTTANQFLIRASGGVGIGLTNPTSPLHVASAGSTPQVQITQNTGSDFTRLRMNVSGSPSWEMDVSNGATPSISWWTGVVRMSLDYNGNLTTSGTVNGTSDRNAKEKFTAVSSRAVLDKVAALPISEWNFKNEPATRHIGPMAQDFYAAFSVGMDDRHIATVDEGGVALAAIQGLHELVGEKEARIAALEKRLAELEQQSNERDARLARLERAVADKLAGLRQASAQGGGGQ